MYLQVPGPLLFCALMFQWWKSFPFILLIYGQGQQKHLYLKMQPSALPTLVSFVCLWALGGGLAGYLVLCESPHFSLAKNTGPWTFVSAAPSCLSKEKMSLRHQWEFPRINWTMWQNQVSSLTCPTFTQIMCTTHCLPLLDTFRRGLGGCEQVSQLLLQRRLWVSCFTETMQTFFLGNGKDQWTI
jgi:hypothetical protein